MFRTILAAAIFALATLPALADPGKVKDVNVEADLSAIKNPEAAKYWTDVSNDLENAIVGRLTDRLDPEKGSVEIRVKLDTVRLANAWTAPLADSQLAGRVVMRDDTDATEGSVYDLSVTMEQAKVFLPQGMDIATLAVDSREYYDAVVAAFADAVVRDYEK